MSYTLKELRAAAEPYKSFPKAIAAIVRCAFDRGATYVEIRFADDGDGDTNVFIKDNGRELNPPQMRGLIGLMTSDHHPFPVDNVGLTFVHHALMLEVVSGGRRVEVYYTGGVENVHDTPVESNEGFYHPVEICLVALGKGEGVNPRQDRSAKRLIRELPKFLSTREASATTVVNETGAPYKLVNHLPGEFVDLGAFVDGFQLDWPEKMIGFGRDGLVLKFGAVRVPLKRFLHNIELSKLLKETIDDLPPDILTHPWLQGIVELTPNLEPVQIPVPTKPADDFEKAFYLDGLALTLAQMIVELLPGVIVDQFKHEVSLAVSDFAEDQKFCLNGRRYKVVLVGSWTTLHAVGRDLWCNPWCDPQDDLTLLLNVTHPVFRTIHPMDEEIMQIVWWQLAMWIASNQPEVYADVADPQMLVTKIYLALREQNPERDWSAE